MTGPQVTDASLEGMLKDEILRMYEEVAENPRAEFHFFHGREAAEMFDYDREWLDRAPEAAVASFAGVGNPHLRSNITPPEPYIVNIPPGKANEVVAVFKRVPASKLSNTNLANSNSGETWQNISNRTGVSVADLMAANPGMASPRGKVFVPVSGNNVQATSYSRPTNAGGPSATNAVRTVKAKAGDTVQKVAERNNANPTEVAKFNGLLPNSVLGAGREIKIPSK